MNPKRPHLPKPQQPPPAWVALFMRAANDESLDAVTPSRRAVLVAEECLTVPSKNLELHRHRLAVALDREPMHLYQTEREVSPLAPVEVVENTWKANLHRAMVGGS